MMSTARRFSAILSHILLGAFAGGGWPSHANFDELLPRPRVGWGRTGKGYPFSSDRQHQRAADRLHMVVMRNGHEVMQQRRRAA